jgi:plastocyanin
MLRFRILILVAVTAAALGVAASADAATPPKVFGTVGPGFTITLKRTATSKLLVKTLKAGTYSITVSDRSSIHNFHLKGPRGFTRMITTVSFVGTKTIVVKLTKGVYTYICDPHLTTMKGTFTVT